MMYKELGQSTIDYAVLNIALDDTPWQNYFNFDFKPIPKELYMQDKLFKWLSNRYKFNVGIIKLNPFECYRWHKDTKRGVGINMMVQSGKSYCLFETKDKSIAVCSFEELKYKPKTYYLFNTQVPHTVINFDKPRYMMSVEFEQDKDALSYEDLLSDLI